MTSEELCNEQVHRYTFRGIIANMSQHEKKTKSINEPHTTFTFACSPVDQKKFEEIIENIALGGHCADIHIVTKNLEKKN